MALKWETNQFQNLDVGSWFKFSDADGNGDLDLFVGEFNGNINFYQNNGSNHFELVTQSFPENRNNSLEYSFPHFSDLDRDGDLDLLVGNESGTPVFYRNTGSAQSQEFMKDTTLRIELPPRSSPVLKNMDGDGDKDMISGTGGGGIVYFQNEKVTGIDTKMIPAAMNHLPGHLKANFPNPFNPVTSITYSVGIGAII